MCHGKWHLSCCVLPIAAKVFWLLALVSLIMAWVASASVDGLVCLVERVNGACPKGGLPVAHLFLDSLSLGVLALGLKLGALLHRCSSCEGCDDCGSCEAEGEEK